MVYPDKVTFPENERTTYTFGAMVLAADALSNTTPAAGLFRGECLPAALDLAEPHCAGAGGDGLHRRLTPGRRPPSAGGRRRPGAARAGSRRRRPR